LLSCLFGLVFLSRRIPEYSGIKTVDIT